MEPFDNDETRPLPRSLPPDSDLENDALDDAMDEAVDDADDDAVDDEAVTRAQPVRDGQADDPDDQASLAGSDDSDETQHESPRQQPRRGDDARVRVAIDFVSNVLREMEMDVSVRYRRARSENSRDEIHLEIVGPDVGRVIGKKGQVLASLQYLVNRVANRPGLERKHLVLDAEGYRHRRETTLAALARRLAEQAAKEGKIITFEPMSPRDRRIVHLALSKVSNVVTKSDGEGDERRVRIIPVRR